MTEQRCGTVVKIDGGTAVVRFKRTNADGSMSGARVYSFLQNPKKFYAYGTNGMLNITYKF